MSSSGAKRLMFNNSIPLPRKPYRLRDDAEEYDGAEQTTDDNGMHNFRVVPCFRSIMGLAVVREPGMNFEHPIRLVLTSMMNMTVLKTTRGLSPSVKLTVFDCFISIHIS
jgi:hypothetical protein